MFKSALEHSFTTVLTHLSTHLAKNLNSFVLDSVFHPVHTRLTQKQHANTTHTTHTRTHTTHIHTYTHIYNTHTGWHINSLPMDFFGNLPEYGLRQIEVLHVK